MRSDAGWPEFQTTFSLSGFDLQWVPLPEWNPLLIVSPSLLGMGPFMR